MFIPIMLTVILILLIFLITIFWRKALFNLQGYEENTENLIAYDNYMQAIKKVVVLSILFAVTVCLLILVVALKKL